MNSPLANRNAASWQRSPWVRLATVVLVVGFLLLRPKLDGWLNGSNATGETRAPESSDQTTIEPSAPSVGSEQSDTTADSEPAPSDDRSSKKTKSSDTATTKQSDDETKNKREQATRERLTEIRPDTFESLAGLIYGKGSEDGHRLKHIMQHAQDIPSKKVHGVYDGDREQILEWIDDVWTRYQKKDSTVRSSLQNNRIVMTAKMNERIGYVGGEEGERKGHPECRYLRVVVDKPNRIVTAYPVQSY